MADIEYVDVLRALPVDEDAEISGLGPNGLAARTTTLQARLRAALTLASAFRDTDSFERPGENYYGWTYEVTKAPPAAPVFMGDAFATGQVGTASGQALIVTGPNSAGPIEVDRLEDTDTIQYIYAVQRVTPDAGSSAANTLDVGVATFSPAGAYIATIYLSVPPLLSANGLTFYKIIVSKIPGRGTTDIPTATRYSRPFVNVRAGGKVGIVSIVKKDQLSALAGLIDGGERATSISLTDDFGFSSAGVSKKTSFENFIQEMRKVLYPAEYTTFETINVTQKSRMLRGVDPDLRKIEFQAPSASIGSCPTGQRADLAMTTPTVVANDGGSGQITFGADGCTRPLAFVGSIASPVTVALTRLSRNYTKYDLFGDDLMSYWPDQDFDDRLRTAMRIALNGLHSDNIIDYSGVRKGRFMFFAGATDRNNRINLFDVEAGRELIYNPGTTGITTTPYFAITPGGDAYVDTGMDVSALAFETTGHGFVTKVGSTALDPDGIQIGNSASYYLSSNITNVAGGSRTGGGRDLLDSAPGQMIAFARNNADNYTQYVNGVPIKTITRPTGALPSGKLFLCGVPASGGASAFSKSPLRLAIGTGGFNSQDSAMLKIYQRMQPVLDACDAIRANP